MAEIESMCYTTALASRLMLRGLEQETKVGLRCLVQLRI